MRSESQGAWLARIAWFGGVAGALLVAGCGEVHVPGQDGGPSSGADASGDGSVDGVQPSVSSTEPTAFAAGVAAGVVIRVTFSEEMDPTTLTPMTFTVDADGAPVEGRVSYEGAVATFTPSGPIAPGTPYVARISAGVADLAGNSLAEPYAWSFTTQTTRCVSPAKRSGCVATIGEAIAASRDGESIAVAAGRYRENLLVTKTVTLLGGYSAEFDRRDPFTLISEISPADPAASVIRVVGVEDSSVVAPILDGFTVTGARAAERGGGIHVAGSDVQLRRNVITDNQSSLPGGGVAIEFGAPLLLANRIVNNAIDGEAANRGGGVYLEQTRARVVGNVIAGNRILQGGAGGGIFVMGSMLGPSQPVTLVDNIINDNRAGSADVEGSGGGIAVVDAFLHLQGGEIVGNEIISIGSGGGLHAFASVLTVDRVRILDNAAGLTRAFGSGVQIDLAELTMTSSIIAGNRRGEAGIWLGESTEAAIINCTIAANPARGLRTESALTLANSIVVGEPIGVELFSSEFPVVFVSNDFFDNGTDTIGIALDASNIRIDPKLDSTLHLTAGSPVVDVGAAGPFVLAGSKTMIDLPAADVDGEARAMPGSSDQARVDIGADELAGAAP